MDQNGQDSNFGEVNDKPEDILMCSSAFVVNRNDTYNENPSSATVVPGPSKPRRNVHDSFLVSRSILASRNSDEDGFYVGPTVDDNPAVLDVTQIEHSNERQTSAGHQVDDDSAIFRATSALVSPNGTDLDDQALSVRCRSNIAPFPTGEGNSDSNALPEVQEVVGHAGTPYHYTSARLAAMYPLHAAAEKGKVKTLERLLRRREDDNLMDFRGATPLHYACGFAYQKTALKMAEMILNYYQIVCVSDPGRRFALIDHQDFEGETALHIAAKTSHSLVVKKLLLSSADLNIKNKKQVEALHLIYQNVPYAMNPVFDSAVRCKQGDPNDENLVVSIDLGAIVGYARDTDQFFQIESNLLSQCFHHRERNRSDVLLHPLVQTFLCLKWRKIRRLLWMSMLYHVVWLVLYTSFICNLYLVNCPYRISNDSLTTCQVHRTDYQSPLYTELGFLLFVTVSVVLKEVYEMFSTPKFTFYLRNKENIGQWLLIVLVFLTSLPVLIMRREDLVDIHAWQYQAAALGILLAWSLILSQVRKFPRLGIYIEILSKVLQSFVLFMMTFSALIVAFTIAFQILLPQKTEFEGFRFAFIKVLVMMVGEIDFEDTFYGDKASTEVPFPASTKFLYAAFVSVVTIILFNLLIGLTVSDIQGLQDGAKESSMSTRLKQIYLMEKFIISKDVQRLLQKINRNHWLKIFLLTQQSDNPQTNMKIDLSIKEIPSHLREKIREKAKPIIALDDEVMLDDEGRMSPVRAPTASSSTLDADLAQADRSHWKDLQLRVQMKSLLKELLDEMRERERHLENKS